MYALTFFIYTLAVYLLAPVIFLAFVFKYGFRQSWTGLGERLGRAAELPRDDARPVVWIHAASVGEVRAAEPFIRRLKETQPGLRCVLSTTTVAGRDLARSLALVDDARLAPLDIPFCIRRRARHWKPRAAVIIETELWPQFIATLSAAGVPLFVINGRLSQKTLPLYSLAPFFWRPLLAKFRGIGVQNKTYRDRFVAAGADPQRTKIGGNLKFDVTLPSKGQTAALRASLGLDDKELVWVCGSTHAGEEEIVLDIFFKLKSSNPRLRLILAPRHINRVSDLERLILGKAVSFEKLSGFDNSGKLASDVLLVDLMGRLTELYGAADIAFVGGSLIPRGGQNILEPARWRVPTLFGPHMDNFSELAERFLVEERGCLVRDGNELAARVAALLGDAEMRQRFGAAALRAAQAEQGAVERYTSRIRQSLTEAPRR